MGRSKHVTNKNQGRGNTEDKTRQMAENMLKNSKALAQFKKSGSPLDLDRDGIPNLHLAVYLNNLKALNLLIHSGEDVNFRANNGYTPLLIAVHRGHTCLIKTLLDAGANPNITDNEGNDALMTAVSKSDSYSFKLIWRHVDKNGGYDPNYTNKAGYTILLLAAESGCEKCYSFLQQNIGNAVSQQTRNGQTALMLAAQGGSLRLIKTIFEQVDDILKEDHAGATALCYSITSRHQNNFDFFHEQMDHNLVELYIKRRIELLANPPSALQNNPSNFYRTLLFPVLLHIRNQVRDGLDILLQNGVFHGLSACRHKHIQQDEHTLAELFRLIALLLQKQVETLALDQFLDSLGPEMALSVMTDWPEPRHLPLRMTAFLSLQKLVENERGRSWLSKRSKDLAPHVKSFYRNTSCINYCLTGDQRSVWKSFLKWYKEVTPMTDGRTEEDISAGADEEVGLNSISALGSPARYGTRVTKETTPSSMSGLQHRSGYANALKHNLPPKMAKLNPNADKIPMVFGSVPAYQQCSNDVTSDEKNEDEKGTSQVSGSKSSEINPISKNLVDPKTRGWNDGSSLNASPYSSDVCLLQSSTKELDVSDSIDIPKLEDEDRPSRVEGRESRGCSSTLDSLGGYWVKKDQKGMKEEQQRSTKDPIYSSAGDRFLKIWKEMALANDGPEDDDNEDSSDSEAADSSKMHTDISSSRGTRESTNGKREETPVLSECPVDNSTKDDSKAESLEMVWLEKTIRYNRYFHQLILQPIEDLDRVGNVYYSKISSAILKSRSSYLGLSVDGKEMFIKHLKVSSENMKSIRSMLSKGTAKHCNLLTPKMDLSNDFDHNGYLLSEVCECNLDEYIKHVQEPWYSYDLQAKSFVSQMLDGLQFLHQQHILHGRLKPQNMIIKNSKEVLLSDFGLSKLLPVAHGIMNSEKEFVNECGHCWRPRECIASRSRQLANEVFTEASDVQVAGMLAHFILSGGQNPFGRTVIRCQLNILRGERSSTVSFGKEADQLIAAMTAYAPKDRPSANAALLYVRKNTRTNLV